MCHITVLDLTRSDHFIFSILLGLLFSLGLIVMIVFFSFSYLIKLIMLAFQNFAFATSVASGYVMNIL